MVETVNSILPIYNPIDSVVLNFNEGGLLLLNITLALVMFGLL